MVAVDDRKGSSVPMGHQRTFSDTVTQSPQPLPVIEVPLCAPKVIDGECCLLFSKEKTKRSTAPFKFSLVMKFLRQRPSLDGIRSFIRHRWGLNVQSVVFTMQRPFNLFIFPMNQILSRPSQEKLLKRMVYLIDASSGP